MRGGISLVLLCLTLPAFAQPANKLKERRERLLKEIEMTDQALQQTQNRQQQALESLMLVEQQLTLRQEVITQLRVEADTLRQAILRLGGEVERAARAGESALLAYRRLARYRLYYRLQGGKPLIHFLAAPRLGEAFQRALFYDRLALRRSEAARVYRKEQSDGERLRSEKEEARREVDHVLALEEKQKSRIELECTERGNLVRQLQRNASVLEADLKARQTERTRLEEAIAEAIRKEIEAEEARARKTAAAKPAAKSGSPSAALPSTPAASTAMGEFARNKGRLPWPVDHAVLTRPFGEQRHPDLPQVRINNTGIDLRTHPAAPVKAVFDGVVTGVQWVPGYAYTLILRHGNYYSVYSNMEVVAVRKGDTIKAGTVVGQASKDPLQGAGSLHFEIWSGKNRQDPSQWLTQKR
jgi:murein hydrolase activator